MARRSRKQRADTLKEQKAPIWRAAIYARLSVEDNGIERNSIENQLFIMREFVKTMPEILPVREYVDNGRTGTDFQRPAFQTMMDDIRKGTLNCVLVKDLSRFGRNYLETGTYLENIFPWMGVRFLSVNDGFDSLRPEGSDALLLPLKAILHDSYARDISRKISTSLDVKKKSGAFLGKIPPYGYVRDPQDRSKLAVHPKRAEIVRQIFEWRAAGEGPGLIAGRLNRMGIPTQLQLRFQEGRRDGKEDARWHGSTVSAILKNPCYIGCIVERKGSSTLYTGGRTKVIPRSKWHLIEHTHQPMIDRELFWLVQKLSENGRTVSDEEKNGGDVFKTIG